MPIWQGNIQEVHTKKGASCPGAQKWEGAELVGFRSAVSDPEPLGITAPLSQKGLRSLGGHQGLPGAQTFLGMFFSSLYQSGYQLDTEHMKLKKSFTKRWQLILMIQRFLYLWNCLTHWNVFIIPTPTPEINIVVLLLSFADRHRAVKEFRGLPFPAEAEQRHPAFLFQLSYLNKCPFQGLPSATFFIFLCLWLVFAV